MQQIGGLPDREPASATLITTRDFWLTAARLRLAVDKSRTGNLTRSDPGHLHNSLPPGLAICAP